MSKAEFKSIHGIRDRTSQIADEDTYTWSWHGSNNVAEGNIIETNGKDLLKFTFLECLVTVHIKKDSGENVIELVQSQIPLDEESRLNYYVGCTRGWTFYMTNLKSILEGGIDLRNKNIDLTHVINT